MRTQPSDHARAWFRRVAGYELGEDPHDTNWTDDDLAAAYESGRRDAALERLVEQGERLGLDY